MPDPLLHPIGTVRSPLRDPAQAPMQGDHSCPEAELVIEPGYQDALDKLHPGQEIEVLTWLHLADRSLLRCHPRGDPERPLHGVFATRSPNRPNPIGLHRVTLLGMQGTVLRVHPLEAVDGTPVVDIKPSLDRGTGRFWGAGIPTDLGRDLQRAGRNAWSRGLVSGMSGNLSCRLGTDLVITRSGSAKGHLAPGDLAVVDLETGKPAGSVRASSEWAMHAAVYRSCPDAAAVVHTHPPHLLALSLSLPPGSGLISLPLFEAGVASSRLGRVAGLPPGSEELAEAVGREAAAHEAVFLQNHGLVSRGRDLVQALALADEGEALARIALLAGRTPAGAATG